MPHEESFCFYKHFFFFTELQENFIRRRKEKKKISASVPIVSVRLISTVANLRLKFNSIQFNLMPLALFIFFLFFLFFLVCYFSLIYDMPTFSVVLYK